MSERDGHPASKATPEHPFVLTKPFDRRLRAIIGGKTIVDSKRAIYFWFKPYYPHYAFPEEDIVGKASVPITRSNGLPEGYVSIPFNDVEHWFEEDEQVIGHAKDPYRRLDVLTSSRHVVVKSEDGTVIAETKRPLLLYETGLRTRTYIPIADVRTDLLEPSPGYTTLCPYKSWASYYHVKVNDRKLENGALNLVLELTHTVVWYYPAAYPAVAQINGHLAFYDESEHLRIFVDGVEQPR